MRLGFPIRGLFPAMDKKHPRVDNWAGTGMLYIEIKGKDGAPVVPAYDTKEKVLRGLATVLPAMESRLLRNEHRARQVAAMREEQMRQMAMAKSGKGQQQQQQQLQQQPSPRSKR